MITNRTLAKNMDIVDIYFFQNQKPALRFQCILYFCMNINMNFIKVWNLTGYYRQGCPLSGNID